MYKNLIGEMAKNGITNSKIAQELGISGRAVRNKTQGKSDFTWKEAVKIHNVFFSNVSLQYLFAIS